MKTFMAFILCMTTRLSLPAVDPPPEILKAEIRELQSVVRTLRERNETLEQRNEQLMRDIVQLGQQIRALTEQAGNDQPPVASTPKTVETEGNSTSASETTDAAASESKILYVNPHWHYLVINAGSEAGIQVGMVARVIRDGESIGSATVTDTKPSQSVADLDVESLSEAGVYPRKADKVVFP